MTPLEMDDARSAGGTLGEGAAASPTTANQDGNNINEDTVTNALDFEDTHNGLNGDDSKKPRGRSSPRQVLSSSAVLARYVGLSGASVVLTAFCPESQLWQSHTARLGLLAVYVAVLVSLWFLHGSDPGYITAEMMSEWNDGASLEGGDDKLENGLASSFDETCDMAESAGTAGTTTRQRHTLRTEDNNADQMDPLANDDDDHVPMVRPRTRRPFCEKCGMDPPLRSHHCKVCDKHVAMFDHHCDFVGKCIGERNHCRFWWFLTAQAAGFYYLTHYGTGTSPYGLGTLLFYREDEPMSNALFYKAVIVIVAQLYVYPLSIAAWLVWAIHTFLAMTNSTTFEWTKGARHLEYLRGTQATDLPYSHRRLDQNLRYFCCQRDDFCNNKNTDWKPRVWFPPSKIVRDSEDWWEHPWQNKYWSCC